LTFQIINYKVSPYGGFAAFEYDKLTICKPKVSSGIAGENYIGNLYWQGTKIAKRPYIQGPYSKGEIALLKKQYPATSAVTLAGKLKRSLISVQKQLREMGIGRRDVSDWTAAQLRYLRKNYRETATWEIANKLNMTPSVVKHKAAELKLKKR
jgi:hypothetical protein